MNWYLENRWLGNFLIAVTMSLLLALWFLLHARSAFAKAFAEFNQAATERARLEHLNPFPNEGNLRKIAAALENYGATLAKTKEELSKQVVALAPLESNEFQSRLRQSILSITERARANQVKLPTNFYLGFNEFATTLPDTAGSSLLGEELGQIELLMNILIDAHVDAVTNLKRVRSSAGNTPGGVPAKKLVSAAGAEASVVQRAIVDLSFTASSSEMRKVFNQIAGSEQQFFIIRALHIRNEQQKGPSREETSEGGTAEAPAETSSGAIKFIVGNEHLETTATVELVRFAF
jgi:hypothetical protein